MLFLLCFPGACADIEEVKKMKNQQPNFIDELMESIEGSLLLQGATANEDKLQPGVPDTIAQLARAGMRVWMVTGDKQETAVNIGFATKLLDDSMRQVCEDLRPWPGLIQSVQEFSSPSYVDTHIFLRF